MKARGIRASEWFTSADESPTSGPKLHRFVSNTGLSVCGRSHYGTGSMPYRDYSRFFINRPVVSEYNVSQNTDDYICDECREYMCDCGRPLKDNERECWRCRHSATRGKIWLVMSIAGVVGVVVSIIRIFV